MMCVYRFKFRVSFIIGMYLCMPIYSEYSDSERIASVSSGHPTNMFAKGALSGKAETKEAQFEARLEYARLLSYMQKYDESLKEYLKLIEINPQSSVVKFEMAKILYYQEKYDEALKILQDIPPSEAPSDDGAAQLLTAEIYLAAKDYPQAEAAFKSHIGNHPNDLAAKFKLAELLSWQKKYNASIHLYQEILEKRPDDVQVRRKYANVLMWMGKFDEAAKELEKTLEQ
jgi:tetratricopeptide (TPR) repeat protein